MSAVYCVSLGSPDVKDRDPAWPKHQEIKAGLDGYERSLLVDEELKLVSLSPYLVPLNNPNLDSPHRSAQTRSRRRS